MYVFFVYLAFFTAGAAELKLRPGQGDVVRRAVSAPLEIKIDNQFGAVRIELVESPTIEARAENLSTRAARVRVGPDQIHVRTQRPRAGGRFGSVDLHVRLPSNLLAALNVRARGTVRIEDLMPGAATPRRDVNLVSIEGDVSLRQHVMVGKFDLKNAQGELRLIEEYPPSVNVEGWALLHFSRSTGTLEAHRTSGDLHIMARGPNGVHVERHQGGKMFVTAEAGKVIVDGTRAWTTLRSTSGPIYARENRGRLLVATESGSLELYGHRAGHVEFRGQTGAVVAIDNVASLDLNSRTGAIRVVETAGDVRVWAPSAFAVEIRDQIWGAIDVYTNSGNVVLHNPKAIYARAYANPDRVPLGRCLELLDGGASVRSQD